MNFQIFFIISVEEQWEKIPRGGGDRRFTEQVNPPLILSRNYVHHVDPNEPCIRWKEFMPIACFWWDLKVLLYFISKCRGPIRFTEKSTFKFWIETLHR